MQQTVSTPSKISDHFNLIPLLLQHKADESSRHSNTIMMLPYPVHTILVQAVVEDTPIVPVVQQLRHDISVELWMSLHRNQALLLVHALHVAARRVPKVLDGGRPGVDDVLVHLVDGLACQ